MRALRFVKRLTFLLFFSAMGTVGLGAEVKGIASSAWRVRRVADPMTDAVSITATAKSLSGSELRCSCTSDGKIYVFLVLPEWTGDEYTLAEIRIDKAESHTYTLYFIQHQVNVSSMGGANKGFNLLVYERGVNRALSDVADPAKLQVETRELMEQMSRGAKLVYRLSLAKADVKGREGSFDLKGFNSAWREIERNCPGQSSGD